MTILALAALAALLLSRSRGGAESSAPSVTPPPAPPPAPPSDGASGSTAKTIGIVGAIGTGVAKGAGVIISGVAALGGAAVPLAWLTMAIAAAIFAALTAPVWTWRATRNAWLKSGGDSMAWRHARRFAEELVAKYRPTWKRAVVKDSSHDVIEGQLNWFGDLTLFVPPGVTLPALDSFAVYDWLDWLRKTPRPTSPDDVALAGKVAAVSEAFGRGALLGARCYISLCDGTVYTGGALESAPCDDFPPVNGVKTTADVDADSKATALAAGFDFAVRRLAPLARNPGGSHILKDRDDATIAYQLAMVAGESGVSIGYEGGSVVIGKEKVGPWRR